MLSIAETIRVDLTAKDPYAKPVQEMMARLGLDSVLAVQRRIVIRPNLVTEAAPPVTTDVRCVEAIARFCLMGMRGSHLGGPVLSPPAGVIIAGRDPVAVDVQGARILGYNWRNVEHLRLAHGLLGYAC